MQGMRSGSGTTSLVFRYEVTEDDTDSDGISVPSRICVDRLRLGPL